MNILSIVRKSHHVVIKTTQSRCVAILEDIARRFVYKSFIKLPGQKPGFGPVKDYFSRLFKSTEYRFHINQYPGIQYALKDNYIKEGTYPIETHTDYEIRNIEVELNPEYVLRDNQTPIYEYIIKNDYPTKFIGAATGHGKSLMTVAAICHLKQLPVFIIKPQYFNNWIDGLQKYTNMCANDIIEIQGSDELKALISQAISDTLECKAVIVSNRTYANYINEYELFGNEILNRGFDCLPEDFFQVLKAGIYVVDEIHQEFFSVFKTLLYTHVNKFICMSATLINRNPFLEKMYKIVCPVEHRAPLPDYQPYIKVTAISYSIDPGNRIRTTEWGNTMYSHHAFEESIIRNTRLLKDYFKLIEDMVRLAYIKDYMPGDKIRIFASSIDMCTRLTRHLKYVFKDLNVARFVEDDPYENLMDPDITVTTILSGGTAHDIPNLRACLLTINIDSIQSNLQTIGRLRKLKDRDVKFFYIYCEDILKHSQYHSNRRKSIKERMLTYTDLRYGKTLGHIN